MADLSVTDLRIAAGHVISVERRARLDEAADLLAQGWRLTPPPQAGTVTVNADDLRVLLERGDPESESIGRRVTIVNAKKRLVAALAEATS